MRFFIRDIQFCYDSTVYSIRVSQNTYEIKILHVHGFPQYMGLLE